MIFRRTQVLDSNRNNQELQLVLGIYTQMLADMAGVEDLTKLEDV